MSGRAVERRRRARALNRRARARVSLRASREFLTDNSCRRRRRRRRQPPPPPLRPPSYNPEDPSFPPRPTLALTGVSTAAAAAHVIRRTRLGRRRDFGGAGTGSTHYLLIKTVRAPRPEIRTRYSSRPVTTRARATINGNTTKIFVDKLKSKNANDEKKKITYNNIINIPPLIVSRKVRFPPLARAAITVNTTILFTRGHLLIFTLARLRVGFFSIRPQSMTLYILQYRNATPRGAPCI